MRLNLIVIRTQGPKSLKSQYEHLGLEFAYHKHGNGPSHYASENAGLVFEIYPLPKPNNSVDVSLRLGFEVGNLMELLAKLEATDWKILSHAKETEWGLTAIIQDWDGRKIELTNKA